MVISRKFKVQSLKYKAFFLGSLFFLLSSCSYKPETPPPPDLIEEAQMAEIITDISISEAILTNVPLASMNDSIKRINVLKDHGVSAQRFLSSMKYYSENPYKLQDIYLQVSDNINAKLGVVDTSKK
ncbi:MAG: DUF4296 domain-containing protein [Bacteroidia bacterium]